MGGVVLGVKHCQHAWWAKFDAFWASTTIQAREMLGHLYNVEWILRNIPGDRIHIISIVDNSAVVGCANKMHSKNKGLQWMMTNHIRELRQRVCWVTCRYINTHAAGPPGARVALCQNAPS